MALKPFQKISGRDSSLAPTANHYLRILHTKAAHDLFPFINSFEGFPGYFLMIA
jgi:hypothetical protein